MKSQRKKSEESIKMEMKTYKTLGAGSKLAEEQVAWSASVETDAPGQHLECSHRTLAENRRSLGHQKGLYESAHDWLG